MGLRTQITIMTHMLMVRAHNFTMVTLWAHILMVRTQKLILKDIIRLIMRVLIIHPRKRIKRVHALTPQTHVPHKHTHIPHTNTPTNKQTWI